MGNINLTAVASGGVDDGFTALSTIPNPPKPRQDSKWRVGTKESFDAIANNCDERVG